MLPVIHLLEKSSFPAVHRSSVRVLQANLGYRCNQSCVHCHVNAGPNRSEEMSAGSVDLIIDFLTLNPGISTLDVTGGAPELNPHFRRLVSAARSLGRRVVDRCNLTVLSEPGMEWLADFLAEQGVDVVASLPCYLEENVDRQRGHGSFAASIRGLKLLNARGYGLPDGGPSLALVYNPQGAVLPPPQVELEEAYRVHLREEYGIQFTRLLALTNMPIQRFGSTLLSRKEFASYMEVLKGAHRPANLSAVMCRDLLSIDWQGYVYDCDFNQQLGLPLGAEKHRRHLSEISAPALTGAPIRVAEHCYGCTAGQGSSCGGALTARPAGGHHLDTVHGRA
ncbi:arsenosugar biosynthesis radical SAM (seleno)protein ArsS [Pseudothauera rhizosphaerae]|uniref:Radical SAM/Cys-rich domain protein n=1 Tax=Pseudothauera rhizosphaerae TaxID=2565932 RepID=A0A4S4ATW5_9RHOO|nr:arsenosugar biosynthesis radical SAM (seleno)protein ArsS [Pseudothauera rhizosphaerae]THF62649.1 radical SAM/Cys-rich domain protein [Pseudothauera rhizosphaerae]